MRLFTKIFLCGTLVFGLAFSVSGYFLLHYSMESSLAREAEFALKQYQYDKFTIQSALLTFTDIQIALVMDDEISIGKERKVTIWESFSEALPGTGKESQWGDILGEGKEDIPSGDWVEGFFAALVEESSLPAAFYAEDGTLLFSQIEGMDAAFLESLSENAHVYKFQDTPEGCSVLVGSMLEWDGVDIIRMLQKRAEGQAGGSAELPDAAGDTQSEAGELVWMPEKGLGTTEIWRIEAESLWKATETASENTSKDRQKIYFVTQWDISKIVQQQETLRQYFIRFYLVAMTAGMILLGIWSAFFTRPLKRMSKAAYRMAGGDYEERLPIRGRDEIGKLAESFNQMAEAVEDKVEALSKAAREKEDFVANFAHELKTPLTSIIGYADMLYQKEMPREKVRDASWYIWNEGMRLEALSLKLMDLIVLGRQDFPLQEMAADELLTDASEGLSPLFGEKGVAFCLEAEPAYIKADYDLLKTLLINLMDNAMKAGCQRIELTGRVQGEDYLISLQDDGCGMEEEELSRITEAFYMVDKARSRKQHGAGLGLALAERIARIHGGKLTFQSRKGEGTRVSLCLTCEKGGEEDEDEEA